MKKIICVIFSFIFSLSLISCSKKTYNENSAIASRLMEIENIASFSDETIKTLAVAYRSSKTYEKETNINKNINKRILNLVNETNNITFVSDLFSENIFYENTTPWSLEIKKSEFLNNLSQKNILLSSLTNIKPINKNDVTTAFNINEKIISYNTLNSFLDFKSDRINQVNISENTISFNGVGLNYLNKGLDLNKCEELASDGKNFSEILLNFDKNGQFNGL